MRVKKLASILATCLLIILASIKAFSVVISRFSSLVRNTNTLPLEYILYIHYLVKFQKDQAKVKALIDSRSEVNAIAPAYVSKLGFKIWATNIEA